MARILRPLAARAESQGWVITQRRCGHLRWDAPDGGTVFTSKTPSDHRAVHAIERDLRKYGFDSKVAV